MPMPRSDALAGRKVLVAEDSYLIAEHVCTILDDHGCTVMGPAPRVDAALRLVEREPLPDCAVLDVNLNGELCFPVARALIDRHVPVIFLTGYDDHRIIPADLASAAVLHKPLVEEALIDVVRSLCARARPSA